MILEIAQLESKLNRAFALAITYYGDEENISTDFYTEGREVLESIGEGDISDIPFMMKSKSINSRYAVFPATARNLASWILDEMRRIP